MATSSTVPPTAADAPSPVVTCSIGIMAYNEAGNIARALESLLSQALPTAGLAAVIAEVIVVASGCTDATVTIVEQIAAADPRVRLIVQERREGKASAINLFLAAAHSAWLVMASADVVLQPGALATLLQPLAADPSVGMVGAHPVPVNDQATFLGHAVHLLWRLHDRIARESPKLGEVVAFRNVVPSIPTDTPVDEISIQALVTQLQYRLVYAPEAIVYNRGPATVRDFLRQRRRIYCGHLLIRRQQRYEAATMSLTRVLRALVADQAFSTPRTAAWTLGTVALEGAARVLGAYDHLRRRPHQLWQMATTTKAAITADALTGALTGTLTGALAGSLAGSLTTGYQSILVFHVVGYPDLQARLGARGAQALLSELTIRIRRTLGVATTAVKVERNGTLIAQAPLDGVAAQERASALVETLRATPLHVPGRPEALHIHLACGIIAIQHTGAVLAAAVPAAAVPALPTSASAATPSLASPTSLVTMTHTVAPEQYAATQSPTLP